MKNVLSIRLDIDQPTHGFQDSVVSHHPSKVALILATFPNAAALLWAQQSHPLPHRHFRCALVPPSQPHEQKVSLHARSVLDQASALLRCW